MRSVEGSAVEVLSPLIIDMELDGEKVLQEVCKVICFTHGNIHVSVLFSHIVPASPSFFFFFPDLSYALKELNTRYVFKRIR